MHLNPYIAGNPVQNDVAFFGRDNIFADVMQMLRHPESNAIVLFGQRRVGKTSVLLQLEQRLESEGHFTPIYFDLQDKASKSLDDVLYELAQRIAAKTLLTNPDRTRFKDNGTYFRETFLPAAGEKANGDLVLLFDEFDVLDSAGSSLAGQTFFPYLRNWMSVIHGVKFVFVIGRRPEDLSIETISTFKGARASRVSLMERGVADAIIRQSEKRDSLTWEPDATERVWEWTHGHPYFTQLLCSVVWEGLHHNATQIIAPAHATDVEKSIDIALKEGSNAFHWIWNGLPPAERIVIAAMAEAPENMFTRESLVEILNRSGVRLIVRELELAPETLTEWELLLPEQGGYKFAVPLFRRWVSTNHPLSRVKEELDRLDPMAETYYNLGQQHYRADNTTEARSMLEQAIRINPNHLEARLLLGRLFLELNSPNESVTVLEEAYKYDEGATRADLIKALLAVANSQAETEQMANYERILQIDPRQWIALERKQKFYLTERIISAAQYEKTEHWDNAIAIYREILIQFPNDTKIQTLLKATEDESDLARRYNEAVGALNDGKADHAKAMLAAVIYRRPDYKEAARHLLRATTGVDVNQLLTQSRQESSNETSSKDSHRSGQSSKTKKRPINHTNSSISPQASLITEQIEPFILDKPSLTTWQYIKVFPLILIWLIFRPQGFIAYRGTFDEKGQVRLNQAAIISINNMVWGLLLLFWFVCTQIYNTGIKGLEMTLSMFIIVLPLWLISSFYSRPTTRPLLAVLALGIGFLVSSIGLQVYHAYPDAFGYNNDLYIIPVVILIGYIAQTRINYIIATPNTITKTANHDVTMAQLSVGCIFAIWFHQGGGTLMTISGISGLLYMASLSSIYHESHGRAPFFSAVIGTLILMASWYIFSSFNGLHSHLPKSGLDFFNQIMGGLMCAAIGFVAQCFFLMINSNSIFSSEAKDEN